MAKRIADKELTDRNWDQEEEGEEVRPGVRLLLINVCFYFMNETQGDVFVLRSVSRLERSH